MSGGYYCISMSSNTDTELLKLTKSQIALFFTLQRLYALASPNLLNADKSITPSNEVLSVYLNCSTQTISRAFKVLSEKELIKVTYANKKSGKERRIWIHES